MLWSQIILAFPIHWADSEWETGISRSLKYFKYRAWRAWRVKEVGGGTCRSAVIDPIKHSLQKSVPAVFLRQYFQLLDIKCANWIWNYSSAHHELSTINWSWKHFVSWFYSHRSFGFVWSSDLWDCLITRVLIKLSFCVDTIIISGLIQISWKNRQTLLWNIIFISRELLPTIMKHQTASFMLHQFLKLSARHSQ